MSDKTGNNSKKRATVISTTIQKGGVGKTTTSALTSFSLARTGRKVLLVDLDSQANTSRFLGINREEPKVTESYKKKIENLMHAFSKIDPDRFEALDDIDAIKTIRTIFRNSAKEYTGMPELISEKMLKFSTDIDYSPSAATVRSYIRHNKEGIDILPSNINMSLVENMMNAVGSKSNMVVKDILKPIIYDYDYIILDCPPSLSQITINALSCADYVIVPASLSDLTFDGLSDLFIAVSETISGSNPSLRFGGILVTKADDRTNILKELREEMENLKKFVHVYKTEIPTNRKSIEQMYTERKSVYSQCHPEPERIAERRAKKVVDEMLEKTKKEIDELDQLYKDELIDQEKYEERKRRLELHLTEEYIGDEHDREYSRVFIENYGKIAYAYDRFVEELVYQIEGVLINED